MGLKTGIDKLYEGGVEFGLGVPTGIDLQGELGGIMPSREWKKHYRGASWFDGDTVNMSIGQGFMLATPMQLAVMTARIASKGKIIQPRLVKSIGSADIPAPIMDATDQIDPTIWTYIHKAMGNVVHSTMGTAKSISRGLTYTMAGKTGTAQVVSIGADEDYDKSKLKKSQWDHALFVAFAPLENPQIAISVIVENGEHGSSTAAPIARKVIDAYLSESQPARLVTKNNVENRSYHGIQ
jgi:penicillin-binding protein 2